jgi:anti-sigma factor RsiW
MAICERIELIDQYHDGELTPEQRDSFEAHLRVCPACALELERLRRLSRFLRVAPRPEMPPGLTDALHGSISGMRERVMVRTARLLAFAATVVLAVCGAWALSGGALREPPPAPVSPWETAAVLARADAASMTTEQQFAGWVVVDLSLENGND